MKLHMDSSENLLRISAYDGASITVSEQRVTSTFALTPQLLITSIPVLDVSDLAWRELAQLHDLGIEILVLGTGRQQQFPSGAFYAELSNARIGLEVMDTGAACRTYNILANEGRRVAAVLMLD